MKEEGSKKILQLENVVILFDEFEKAHHTVKQSLLTMFDEEYCEVNYTSGYKNLTLKYELVNCSIVCTSNLYQQEILSSFEKGENPDVIAEKFARYNSEMPLPTSFSTELLGRINDIIPFGPIPKGAPYQKVIDISLNRFITQLKEELRCREILVKEKDHVLLYLEKYFYGNGTNIRKLKNHFDNFKALIYHHRRLIGNLEDKKIILSYNQKDGLYFSFFIYVSKINAYVALPELKPIIILKENQLI